MDTEPALRRCNGCIHYLEEEEDHPEYHNSYCYTCYHQDNYVDRKATRREDCIGFMSCVIFCLVTIGAFIYALMQASK